MLSEIFQVKFFKWNFVTKKIWVKFFEWNSLSDFLNTRSSLLRSHDVFYLPWAALEVYLSVGLSVCLSIRDLCEKVILRVLNCNLNLPTSQWIYQGEIFQVKFSEWNFQSEIFRVKFSEWNFPSKIFQVKFSVWNFLSEIFREKFSDKKNVSEILSEIFLLKFFCVKFIGKQIGVKFFEWISPVIF